MKDKSDGSEDAQGADIPEQQEEQAPQEKPIVADVDAFAYEAQIAERDGCIAELEAQVAEAAKSAEATEALKSQIEELKKQGESDRIDFALQLAGCRSVKAARAVLEDHSGDIEALKEAEPWMFEDAPARQTGKTGLPNAGTASDAGKELKRWRKLIGLDKE